MSELTNIFRKYPEYIDKYFMQNILYLKSEFKNN